MAWISFVAVCIGFIVFGLYWYITTHFEHIDDDIHMIEAKLESLEEKIDKGFGIGVTGGPTMSWIDFWTKTKELASQVEGSDFDPDIIVSIGRSGTIVGGILASLLGSVKHVSMDRVYQIIEDTTGEIKRRDVRIDLTVTFLKNELDDKKILLVMSECKSGKTFDQAQTFLRNINENIQIKFASIFCKTTSYISPQFCIETTDGSWPQLPFRVLGKWQPHSPKEVIREENNEHEHEHD